MSQPLVKQINVFAQTEYDGDQTKVAVNSDEPLKLETENYDIYLLVRIQGYDSSSNLSYFESENHKNDTFSIQFTIKFKTDVNGADLKWGNDWDHPISSMLPWGFSAAFAAFKYAIDPGVDGDVYSEKPWIYGNLLSSINYMDKVDDSVDPASVLGPIAEENATARQKKFLDKVNLSEFNFKKGDVYAFDFANPYLEMSSTPKIKMPGFTFDVGKYAGMTKLRYVLRNGDNLVFAVVFEAVKA